MPSLSMRDAPASTLSSAPLLSSREGYTGTTLESLASSPPLTPGAEYALSPSPLLTPGDRLISAVREFWCVLGYPGQVFPGGL